MKTSEASLLASGFRPAELQKLKSNIANHGGTLDSVTHDLANRFIAARWISLIALTIMAFTLIAASKATAITLVITLAIVLPFIWFLAPAKLAYKSWRFRKMMISAEQNH